jgi:hypothetical protein
VEHVVFFPAPDGSPAFRRAASLEEAVRLVERMSNDDGITDVTVHALHQVELQFTTYVRVQVPAAEAEVAPEVEAEVAVEPVAEAEVEVAEPVAEVEAEPVAEVEAAANDDSVAAEPAEPADAPEPEPVLVAPNGESNGHREVSGLGFFAS